MFRLEFRFKYAPDLYSTVTYIFSPHIRLRARVSLVLLDFIFLWVAHVRRETNSLVESSWCLCSKKSRLLATNNSTSVVLLLYCVIFFTQHDDDDSYNIILNYAINFASKMAISINVTNSFQLSFLRTEPTLDWTSWAQNEKKQKKM